VGQTLEGICGADFRGNLWGRLYREFAEEALKEVKALEVKK
jgi:hypothetical protein